MAKQNDTIRDYLALSQKIKEGQFSPVYLLHGAEPYFIDSITHQLEEAILPESEKSFNQSVLYGKEIDMNSLIGMARRFPMMSKYQVIIVKEAQNLKDWEKLESYLMNPLDSTVLVICFRNGKFDMRLKVSKAFAKHTVYLSEPLKDYQLKQWLPEFIKTKGRSIDPMALERLVDLLGTDLSVIHNELEKLFITVKEEFIKMVHVEEHVGLNRTYNVFELINALGYRNFNKAVQIAHHMSETAEKVDYVRMVPAMDKFFSKVLMVHEAKTRDEKALAELLGVNSYFVRDYVAAASNYSMVQLSRIFNSLKVMDLKLKGVHRGTSEDGQVLLETVVNIVKN